MSSQGTVYGHSEIQRALLAAVTGAATDLRSQLETLAQHAHSGHDSADVEAVRAALFRSHGWERECHDLR